MSVAVILLLVYGALVAIVYFGQRGLLYHPDTNRGSPEHSGVPEMAEVTYVTGDGLSLAAWYAKAPDGAKTVVYLHGNGGSIVSRGHKARVFLDAGLGLLMVEYRGYGGNPGLPSQEGLYSDARAALAWLAGQGVSSTDVVLFGESLGTGIAVKMATVHPVAAVVLESPYTAIVDIAAKLYWYIPVRWLIKDPFPSKSMIVDVGAPLLIIHGEKDRTVPVAHGRAMLDAAKEPKTGIFLPDAAHNDHFEHGAGEKIVAWLKPSVQLPNRQ